MINLKKILKNIKEKINNTGIYKITSPSGRVYIGQAVNLKNRFNDYYSLQNKLKSQSKLYRSFLKYGVENHQFDIIEYCSREDLNCSERFWQDEFDVLNEGLNCMLTDCGEKRRIVSQETKDKISKAGKGRKHSEETKEKISKSKLGKYLGKDAHNFGKPHTQETKDKISKSNKGKKHSEETKTKQSKKKLGIKKGKYSKEHCDSISKGRIGKKFPNQTKIILCLRTGIFYFGREEAAKARGISEVLITAHLAKATIRKTNKLDLIYV